MISLHQRARQRFACLAPGSLLLAGALLLQGCGGGSSGPSVPTATATPTPVPASNVLLDDKFNSSSFDRSVWSVQGGDYTIQRTLMGNQPTIVNDGSTSFVRLPLSTYVSNATARSKGATMFGTEFASYALFPRSQGLRFKARIRMTSAAQQGLVGAFFLFSSNNGTPQTIDEVDHELLTTAYQKKPPYTWTNIYKNFVIAQKDPQGNPIGGNYDDKNTTLSTAPGFVQDYNTNDWNTYTIEWKAGSVKWFINDKPIRSESVDNYNRVPDAPLGVRFNFWVANSSWQNAYSDSPVLNGVSDPSQAQNFYMDVDYVKVETLDGKAPSPSTSALKRAAPTTGVTMADYRGK